MDEKQALAIANHDKGYNCCQAVVCAFSRELGVDEDILFKAGEGFGLGMGCTECTCGAVSGAVLAAGFKNSTANLEGTKSKADTYRLTREIVNTFTQKNGSMLCKDLKGMDTGNVLRSCPGCIEDAVQITEDVLGL